MKNRTLLVLLLPLFFMSNAFAQVIMGRVTDETNSSVAFANVVLLNIVDSVFITGTVTDDTGGYSIQCNELADNLVIKVTCIGYEPFVALFKKLVSGQIILKDASTQLDEVVVKASRPTFKIDAGTLTARIQNTTLSRLGDASDVLAQLPFMSGRDGKFAVFGRGEPLIYINNNRMRSEDELSKLKSDQIKDIKIIMNPGAEYDATTKAVIKITTFRPVGEGLSGTVQGTVSQHHNFTHAEALSLNYRTGGLDIFAYGHNRYAKMAQKQRTVMSFPFEEITFENKQDGSVKFDVKNWITEGGFNYAFNSNHSLGMKYRFDKNNETPFRTNFKLDVRKDNQMFSQGNTALEVWQRGWQQHLNMYYQGQINEHWLLHFDGDYVSGKDGDNQTTTVTDVFVTEDGNVSNTSGTNYDLYAGKLWAKTSLWEGELLAGIEGSYTKNRQAFDMLTAGMEEEIPTTRNKSKQTAFAPFVAFEEGWGKFTVNAGLRYEYVNFAYYLNGEKQTGQSKIYNNLFPTVSLAYNENVSAVSLNYRNAIMRPSYEQLGSSISYNDPFTYEGGNPALLPSIEHAVNLLISYKDFQFSADYKWVKDYVFFTMMPYEDKPVNLLTFINHDVDMYAIYMSYAPTLSFWKPNFSVGLQGQHLSYEGQRYNKPMFNYSWRNMFQFPHSFLVVLNMEGNSSGNTELRLSKSTFQMDLSVRKELMKGRLKLTLGARDLLDTQRERWSMRIRDSFESKWNNTDTRAVYFSVVYQINSAKNQYKGGNAAENEMNRL